MWIGTTFIFTCLAVDVVADTEFDATRDEDRNVVLYGNAETNAAWATLLGDGPVEVRHGRVRIAKRELSGDDLACLLIRPRPGSDRGRSRDDPFR